MKPWLALLALARGAGAEVLRGSDGGDSAVPPVLLQLEALEGTRNAPLYVVNVNFDWQDYNPEKGVTMKIDRTTRTLTLTQGLAPSEGVAWGHMEDDLAENGWIHLSLQTTDAASVSNDVKMYAIGWLEGLISAARMSQFYSNTHQLLMKDEVNAQALANLKAMFHHEIEYVKKNSNLEATAITVEPPDPYWKHARYILHQLWGIKDGYNFAALAHGVHMLDLVDMLIINSNGELPELMEAYAPNTVIERRKFQKSSEKGSLLQRIATRRPARAKEPQRAAKDDWEAHLSDRDWEDKVARTGHCSAFVRVAPENKDLFVGHTTWNDYSKMTRMFKYIQVNLPNSFASTSISGFSSYPGCVGSTDDFYMLNSGLAVFDTSLEILNPRVYDRVEDFPGNPHVPNFMHVMIVNRLARSGAHWMSLFAETNTGTDNAQWIVVDYNLFNVGKPLPDNTVWVLEKVPGIINTKDVSGDIRTQGYWASYDRPYFKQTRDITGHTAAEAKYGPLYSFASAPRATIFKRFGTAVESIFDMRMLMNRNDYPNEGVLPNEPGHAISARMDLDPVSRLPNGGIDAKVTNRCLFRSLQCQAISGPTHSAQQVFKWQTDDGTDLFPGWPHLGLPKTWDFDWVQMTPSVDLNGHLDDMDSC